MDFNRQPDKETDLKNGVVLRHYKELTEDKGGMLEIFIAVEEDTGRELVKIEKKDEKVLFVQATTDAQDTGLLEKVAKKAGLKESDINYTGPTLNAAQAGTKEKGKGKDDETREKRWPDSESAKLVKSNGEDRDSVKLEGIELGTEAQKTTSSFKALVNLIKKRTEGQRPNTGPAGKIDISSALRDPNLKKSTSSQMKCMCDKVKRKKSEPLKKQTGLVAADASGDIAKQAGETTFGDVASSIGNAIGDMFGGPNAAEAQTESANARVGKSEDSSKKKDNLEKRDRLEAERRSQRESGDTSAHQSKFKKLADLLRQKNPLPRPENDSSAMESRVRSRYKLEKDVIDFKTRKKIGETRPKKPTDGSPDMRSSDEKIQDALDAQSDAGSPYASARKPKGISTKSSIQSSTRKKIGTPNNGPRKPKDDLDKADGERPTKAAHPSFEKAKGEYVRYAKRAQGAINKKLAEVNQMIKENPKITKAAVNREMGKLSSIVRQLRVYRQGMWNHGIAERVKNAHPEELENGFDHQLEMPPKLKSEILSLSKKNPELPQSVDLMSTSPEVINFKKHHLNPNFSDSNGKLSKDGIVSWNLPAYHSCPGKGECASFCYALENNYVYDNVMKPRAVNWGLAERDDFVDRMSDSMQFFPYRNKKGETLGKVVRVHDSGDFYSPEYMDKIKQIAEKNPKIKFYAYTKALKMPWKELHNLPNFTVIQSVGGQHDDMIDPSLPHSYIFSSDDALKNAGYTDTAKSDLPAANAKANPKIGLVIHGTQKKKHSKETFGSDFKGKVEKSMDGRPAGALFGDQIPPQYKGDQIDYHHQMLMNPDPTHKMEAYRMTAANMRRGVAHDRLNKTLNKAGNPAKKPVPASETGGQHIVDLGLKPTRQNDKFKMWEVSKEDLRNVLNNWDKVKWDFASPNRAKKGNEGFHSTTMTRKDRKTGDALPAAPISDFYKRNPGAQHKRSLYHGMGKDNAGLNVIASKSGKAVGHDPYHPDSKVRENPRGKFDMVHSHYTLNVVNKDIGKDILKNIHNLLSDKGKAVISVRNDRTLRNKLAELTGKLPNKKGKMTKAESGWKPYMSE